MSTQKLTPIELVNLAIRTGLPVETSLDSFPALKLAAESLGVFARMEPNGQGVSVHFRISDREEDDSE